MTNNNPVTSREIITTCVNSHNNVVVVIKVVNLIKFLKPVLLRCKKVLQETRPMLFGVGDDG